MRRRGVVWPSLNSGNQPARRSRLTATKILTRQLRYFSAPIATFQILPERWYKFHIGFINAFSIFKISLSLSPLFACRSQHKLKWQKLSDSPSNSLSVIATKPNDRNRKSFFSFHLLRLFPVRAFRRVFWHFFDAFPA